jgi:hypothetical protein
MGMLHAGEAVVAGEERVVSDRGGHDDRGRHGGGHDGVATCFSYVPDK